MQIPSGPHHCVSQGKSLMSVNKSPWQHSKYYAKTHSTAWADATPQHHYYRTPGASAVHRGVRWASTCVDEELQPRHWERSEPESNGWSDLNPHWTEIFGCTKPIFLCSKIFQDLPCLSDMFAGLGLGIDDCDVPRPGMWNAHHWVTTLTVAAQVESTPTWTSSIVPRRSKEQLSISIIKLVSGCSQQPILWTVKVIG